MMSPFCLLAVLPENAVKFAVKKLNKCVLALNECECNAIPSKKILKTSMSLISLAFFLPVI